MKVLHITNRLTGGVLTAIENIVRATPTVEHVVLFIGESADELSAQPSLQVASRFFVPQTNIFKTSKNVKETILNIRADVIHAHSSWAGIYSRLRSLPIPIVYQPHGFSYSNPKYPKTLRSGFWLIEKLLSLRTAGLIAVGKHEQMLAVGLVSEEKVVLLRNESNVPIHPWKIPNQSAPVRIGTIGRVCAEKDPMFFLSIVKGILSHPEQFEFYWIGDGDFEMKSNLERAGVHVTGWIKDEKLMQEVFALDIYLSTSISEGMPFALLDALALGVPAVLRDIPAFTREGLPTAKSPEEFIKVILSMCSNEVKEKYMSELERFRNLGNPSSFAETYIKSMRNFISGGKS